MEEFNSSFYKVFPNPLYGKARISLPDSQALKEVQLVDAVGKVTDVSWTTIEKNLVELEINKPHSGIYVVRIKDSKGLHTAKLLVK